MPFKFKLIDQLDNNSVLDCADMSHATAEAFNREFIERNEFKLWVLQ